LASMFTPAGLRRYFAPSWGMSSPSSFVCCAQCRNTLDIQEKVSVGIWNAGGARHGGPQQVAKLAPNSEACTIYNIAEPSHHVTHAPGMAAPNVTPTHVHHMHVPHLLFGFLLMRGNGPEPEPARRENAHGARPGRCRRQDTVPPPISFMEYLSANHTRRNPKQTTTTTLSTRAARPAATLARPGGGGETAHLDP
jgi:hypothetical protein